MKRLDTIRLRYDDYELKDVQIWCDHTSVDANEWWSSQTFIMADYIDYRSVPLIFMLSKPLHVYSQDGETCNFFKEKLADKAVDNPGMGMLFKNLANSDLYLAIYVQETLHTESVRCLPLSLDLLGRIRDLEKGDQEALDVENVAVALDELGAERQANTSVFDKVLSTKNRRQPSNLFTFPVPLKRNATQTQLSSQSLTSKDQIEQTVSKVVLSGLRLRGLNMNTSLSANDRIAIKEVFRMTHKSALFALRKYKYGFNGKNDASPPIKLNDIQDIVEKLLQLYVDLDEQTLTHNPVQK